MIGWIFLDGGPAPFSTYFILSDPSRAANKNHPFEKYLGILPGIGENINQWRCFGLSSNI
jgi:hypothetical protein